MFHTATESQADFAEGIEELKDCGADVIVDDILSWTANVPADATGPWVVVASRSLSTTISPVRFLFAMQIEDSYRRSKI